jgi:hypothetical protein
MIALPERVVDGNSPAREEGLSSKAVRKVVVIQVKSKHYLDPGRFDNRGEIRNGGSDDSERNAGQVLGSRVVDLKDGRVVFWFIKRCASRCIDFEFSFLQGATAAVVVLELSDHETIQATTELLRDICKVFSIPVMVVVGGRISDDLVGLESASGLAEMASRVISFSHAGKKALQAA